MLYATVGKTYWSNGFAIARINGTSRNVTISRNTAQELVIQGGQLVFARTRSIWIPGQNTTILISLTAPEDKTSPTVTAWCTTMNHELLLGKLSLLYRLRKVLVDGNKTTLWEGNNIPKLSQRFPRLDGKDKLIQHLEPGETIWFEELKEVAWQECQDPRPIVY